MYTCKSEVCVFESERQKWESIYAANAQLGILLTFEEEFSHKTKFVACKASYVERNQAMTNNSDYCVFYYDENYQPKNKNN